MKKIKILRQKHPFLKYLSIFILWVTSVIFTFAYTTIETDLDNAVQYIQKIVLTDNTWSTGVVLDWEGKIKIMNTWSVAWIYMTWYGNKIFATTDGGEWGLDIESPQNVRINPNLTFIWWEEGVNISYLASWNYTIHQGVWPLTSYSRKKYHLHENIIGILLHE